MKEMFCTFVLWTSLLISIVIAKLDTNEIDRSGCIAKNNTVKCLPSFLIGGTQKSGTTVLSGILSIHPEIGFSGRKEVHFFDKKNDVDLSDVESYLQYFPYLPKKDLPIIFGEATPSYIANANACRRISQMVPNIKMIVLMREPVSRAYSEYQMKKRRVDEQQAFLDILQMHKVSFLRCLLEGPRTWEMLESSCFPMEVVKLTYYAKYISKYKDLLKSWSRTSNKLAGANKTWTTIDVPYYSNKWLELVLSCFPVSLDNSPLKLDGVNASQIVELLLHEWDPMKLSQQIMFSQQKCVRLERLKPLSSAFQGEIKAFQKCASSENHTESIDSLDRALQRCIKPMKGISSQYFYRSLYAPQIYRCFQFLPKSNFLFLSSERMKNNLQESLITVLKFLGVANVTYFQGVEEMISSNVSIHQIISLKFPAFEKSTGWSLESSYDPLPLLVKTYLLNFFAPYNQLLYDLLGYSFDSEWYPSSSSVSSSKSPWSKANTSKSKNPRKEPKERKKTTPITSHL